MSEITLENVKQGFAASDIAAVVLTTSTKKYLIKTASEANFRAALAAGAEKELRKKNTILALNKTDDILKGYDVDFTDVLMHPEVLALVEGGVATFAADAFASYSGPVAGQPVVREKFDLDIFCEDLDTDGEVKGYVQFNLKNCKGKPTEFTLKDGDFFTPKYTVESRPAAGQSPITITSAAALPVVPPPAGP